VALSGIPAIIANGSKRGILKALFQGKEEGTIFLPQDLNLCSRKRWIAFTKAPRGKIVVDRGAEKAIVERGKSLLPSGIKQVEGLVNYYSEEVRKIMGLKTTQIEAKLGSKHEDEVIHRDNLAITNNVELGEEACR